MEITFVTGNKNKVKEAEKILGHEFKFADIDLPEIQELDMARVAEFKVTEAYKRVKAPVFVDDGGLYIDALNGFPGPFVKWVLKSSDMTAKTLLKMIEGETNRKATGAIGLGFHDGKDVHTFVGEVPGEITNEMRGENGFGWDSVFLPRGHVKTYAEMSLEEKNEISHRRKALEKFKKFLKENDYGV